MDASQYDVIGSSLPEFIQKKKQDNLWFNVSGDIDDLDDVISYTPISGVESFLFHASIVITGAVNAAGINNGTENILNMVGAHLLINNQKKDETNMGVAARAKGFHGSGSGQGAGSGSGHGYVGDGIFHNALGQSLVGDGVKKIEIKNILDNGNAFARMSGWLSEV